MSHLEDEIDQLKSLITEDAHDTELIDEEILEFDIDEVKFYGEDSDVVTTSSVITIPTVISINIP